MTMVACAAVISASPPSSPVAPQTSTVSMRFGFRSDADAGGAGMEVGVISMLLPICRLGQIDGLDDIPREEQLDQPIAQYPDLTLQAGQFS